MRRIETEADLAEGIAALVTIDPRLAVLQRSAGPVPLRRRAGGFEGLAAIVTGQQISDKAAAAIWGRLIAAIDPFTPDNVLGASDDVLRTAGLSRGKVRTLRGIASAIASGLDLAGLADMTAEDATTTMVALDGIGPWTAECYLLFCVGHPDVFPAGDLALQVAVGHGLQLDGRPSEKEVRAIAAQWSPWRAVAARLFWAYYRTIGRPLSP